MWQHLAHNPEFQRSAILLIPFLASGLSVLLIRPSRRTLTGAFVGFMWNFSLLFICNIAAIKCGWWRFESNHSNLIGIPFDILLGWAAFWGILPHLMLRGKFIFLTIPGMVFIDLIIMPQSYPLVLLGRDWLWGECAAILTSLIPGLILARITDNDTHVRFRGYVQALVTGIFLLFILPATLLQISGGNIFVITDMPSWQWSLFLNAIFLFSIPGLSANQEFADIGKGTPIPFDPPKRLVRSGPYAYVANPMQISICLLLTVMAVACKSPEILGAAFMAFIFSEGFVRWHQYGDIFLRFGDDWQNYKNNVCNWLPRWRPYIPENSIMFFARNCGICLDTERMIARLNPLGLNFEDAANHPSGNLKRATYRHPNGYEEQGIVAIARCLEHINLGWAFFGWFMRLPLIRNFLQILIDGTGDRPNSSA